MTPRNSFENNQQEAFGGSENSVTRRRFLKRTGGATAGSLLAWNLSCLAQQLYEPPASESKFKQIVSLGSGHLTWSSFIVGGDVYAIYLLHQLVEHLPTGQSEAPQFDGTQLVTGRVLKLVGSANHNSTEPPSGVDGQTGEMNGSDNFKLRDAATNNWYEFEEVWKNSQQFTWTSVHDNPERGETATISRTSGDSTKKSNIVLGSQTVSVGLMSVFHPKVGEPVTAKTVQAAVDSTVAIAWDENDPNTTFDLTFTWGPGTGIVPNFEASVNNSTVVKKEESVSHDLAHTYTIVKK